MLALAVILIISTVALMRAYAGEEPALQTPNLTVDVVYCADAEGRPARSYSEGGLRVANSEGVPLFSIPASVIDEVPPLPFVDTLIVAEEGAFGEIALYRLASGQFELTGLDENGQHFIFVWRGCEPAGRTPGNVLALKGR
nr:MAG: hypothetical protein DIU68_20145 [Chloroflexota bacterium]